MCSIEKMLIKGIRSFSPENTAVIEFYKPLTLIVGANGAGKTTVIECLKQACTGELPPNTRSGQSFIHDPKVAKEPEVKALIKLRFTTSTGQPVVVMRSFQLTQKKATMTFKTLDSTVQTTNRDTGEKQAITYRCADIDKMVPSLMGVSKAVLENVIFVHQEESNWPLAEGRVLKDKFDDIFSATKYTKALEALRKLKSEKVGDIKVMKMQLETLRTLRDQALRLKREEAESTTRADAFSADIVKLETTMQSKQGELNSVVAKLRQLAELGGGIEALIARHDMLTRHTSESLGRLKDGDMTESDVELEAFLARFDRQCGDAQSRVDELSRKINSRRIDKEAMVEQYQADCMSHGRLSAEASAHAAHSAELARFMGSSAQLLSLDPPAVSGLAGPALLSAAGAFSSQVAGKVSAAEAELAQLKSIHRSKDASLGDDISKVTAEISRTHEGGRMKSDEADRHGRTITALEAEISMNPVDAGLVEEFTGRVRDLEGKLTHDQGELSRSTYEADAARERGVIEVAQAKISALRQERERLSFVSDSGTKLRLRQQELSTKEASLAASLERSRPKLLRLLGVSSLPPTAEIKADADKSLATQRKDLADKNRVLSGKQAEHAAAQASVNSTRTQVEGLQSGLNSNRAQLKAGMQAAITDPIEEFALAQRLQTAKAEFTEKSNAAGKAAGMMTVMHHHHQHIQDGHPCPVCKRQFADAQERASILEQLEEESAALPMQLAIFQRDKDGLGKIVDALQALQPQWHKVAEVERQLPELTQRLTREQARAAALKMEVDDLLHDVSLTETEVCEHAKVMAEAAWQVDRQHREVEEARAQVSQLQALLGSQASTRSVADADRELSAEERTREEAERRRDGAVREHARLTDAVMRTTSDLNTVRSESARVREGLVKKGEKEAKIRDLTTLCRELSESAAALSAQQAPKEAHRGVLVKQREALGANAAAREGEAEGRLREARQLQDQLASKIAPVQAYEAQGRSKELERMEARMASEKDAMERNQQAVAELEGQAAEAQKQGAELECVRRDATDILEYRRARAQLEEASRQLGDQRAQLQAVGSRSELSQQQQQLHKAYEEARRGADNLHGQLSVTQQAAARAAKELLSPQYKLIEAKFNELRLKLKATEMANEDLEKYYKALEKALLAYHTSKMADINKIIKELWQKTYRGQDIDYIQIKADAEGAGARSYNYRVCMHNAGAELEMRGRCSAGQKVLACLIIRLALAETFCLNCGILALDEPTTNLDADNSASLAEALRQIMVSRREQENFQLIVITHDEEFAHLIGTRENTDRLWRITKDEAQHTKVVSEGVE